MATLHIYKKFIDRYSPIVDDEKAFFQCLETRLPRAFRINTIKADKEKVLESLTEKGVGFQDVAWYEDAFVTDNLEIGNTIDHFIGNIYIQELVSMLPGVIASQELTEKSIVLDAAAAPGSKTTHLASMMGNKGCIVANDKDFWRIKALKFNIEKLGVLNTVITNQDFRFFNVNKTSGSIPIFDFVLLDAPCSSEGTIRKDPDVLKRWSEKSVFGMARLQKQMILKGFDLLKHDKTLLYSTCTFAPEEDEGVIQYLLDNREGVEVEKIQLKGLKTSQGLEKWQKQEFSDQVKNCCRIWPHHNNTGGFFMAKIRKIGGGEDGKT